MLGLSFDLPPGLYNAFQKLLHGDYENAGGAIGAMKSQYPGRALELGCGTGIFSRFFEPGMYVGVDLDSGRVDLAKELQPEHEFISGDVTALDPLWLTDFGFVFCYGVMHHIDDAGINRILGAFDRASAVAGKPIHFLVMEPVMPEKTLLNIPGWMLGKLDRGNYVRKLSRLKALFADRVSKVEDVAAHWYWPIPGVNMVVECPTISSQVGRENEEVLKRASAHA